MSESKAMVRAEGAGIGAALAVLKQADEFATMLSKSQFIPQQFRGNKGDVMAAIALGQMVGLNPLQALQGIAVINGRPSIWGDAALAICRSHPDFEDITETLDTKGREDGQEDGENIAAICVVKRRNQSPTERRFSVADARKAGLWGKSGPWKSYPKRMLQMRARGFALRDAFADALTGMILREEADDYAGEVDITPIRDAELEPFADQPQGRRMSLAPSATPSTTTATAEPTNGQDAPQTTAQTNAQAPETVSTATAPTGVEPEAAPDETAAPFSPAPVPEGVDPPARAEGNVIAEANAALIALDRDASGGVMSDMAEAGIPFQASQWTPEQAQTVLDLIATERERQAERTETNPGGAT